MSEGVMGAGARRGGPHRTQAAGRLTPAVKSRAAHGQSALRPSILSDNRAFWALATLALQTSQPATTTSGLHRPSGQLRSDAQWPYPPQIALRFAKRTACPRPMLNQFSGRVRRHRRTTPRTRKSRQWPDRWSKSQIIWAILTFL